MSQDSSVCITGIYKRHAVLVFGNKRRSSKFYTGTVLLKRHVVFFATTNQCQVRKISELPISMAVLQLPMLSSEIPLRFTSVSLDFSNRKRINFFRPLSAIGDSRSGAPDSESRNRMFILGMGFVGGFFAQQLKEADWSDINFSPSPILLSLCVYQFAIRIFSGNEYELHNQYDLAGLNRG